MKKVICFFIRIYKATLSKWFDYLGVKCKYYPTCSDYMMQAVNKYGALKGSFLGIKRILKCNPLSKGGYDPLK